jgi:hypothetical protein
MRRVIEFLVRVALLAFISFICWWALNVRLSSVINLSIIVGGVLIVFPLVWLGRKMLDKQPTMSRAVWAGWRRAQPYGLRELRLRPP